MAATWDDLERLIKRLVGVLNMLRSANENERRVAADKAAAKLLAAPQDFDWGSLFKDSTSGAGDQAALRATCKQLIADLEAANARIVELESTAPDWGGNVPQLPIGKSNMTARWAAQLFDDGKIFLNKKEVDFVRDHAKWSGPPYPKQVKFLQSIVDNIYRRYRLRPPP